jgi:glutamate N-acetyltransferase/amino-acid N-acetyltransferase
MIRPNMATMLGFVATDAVIAPALMQHLVRKRPDDSFNRITIDGDTSTNDSFLLIATGQAGHDRDHPARLGRRHGPARRADRGGTQLAQAIVRDGEGATKFITVRSTGGKDRKPSASRWPTPSPTRRWSRPRFSRATPTSAASSPRVGYAGIDDLDQTTIDLFLDDVHVAREGGRHPDYREEDGQRVMKQSEITVRVDLNRGDASTTVWTCDLSYDYVKINADYRS